MAEYDDSYKPPDWWLGELAKAMTDLDWGDGEVIKQAREIDGRNKSWGPDRVVKLRRGNATIQLVVAISRALDIAPPIVVARDQKEAEALRRWIVAHRPAVENHAGSGLKQARIEQALDEAVKTEKDQRGKLPSKNERSPRGLGHRRASTRR